MHSHVYSFLSNKICTLLTLGFNFNDRLFRLLISPSKTMLLTRILKSSNITVPISITGNILPYTVSRSVNGELPVYKVFKGNGKIVNTVVKHVQGDRDAHKRDLAKECE